MQEFLSNLSQLVTPAFAISTMLAMGMRLTVGQVVDPLRNWRFVAAALVLSFVLVPSAAWAIGTVLGLEEDLRIGLILVGCVLAAIAVVDMMICIAVCRKAVRYPPGVRGIARPPSLFPRHVRSTRTARDKR
mgnify:CR=1 FL=1